MFVASLRCAPLHMLSPSPNNTVEPRSYIMHRYLRTGLGAKGDTLHLPSAGSGIKMLQAHCGLNSGALQCLNPLKHCLWRIPALVSSASQASSIAACGRAPHSI